MNHTSDECHHPFTQPRGSYEHQMDNPRTSKRGLEENTLAILDFSGINNARDIHDDRLSFLEAVRSASLISDSSSVPTWKMYNAVFHVLLDAMSLEEAMASHHLLIELEKCYPRIYLTDQHKSQSTSLDGSEPVVVKDAWSPFVPFLETSHVEGEKTPGSMEEMLDASGFAALTHEIAQAASIDRQLGLKLVKDMLLFEYLVNILEEDFMPRQKLYKVKMNWVLLRESLLSMLLGSRKINFRNLIRDFMAILPGRYCEKSPEKCVFMDTGAGLLTAVMELRKRTCTAVEKLLILVMELDVDKKIADLHGYTSRADAVRIPLLEIIVDELSYNNDTISPFLEAFSEPKWKLEVVLQYLWKYCNRAYLFLQGPLRSVANNEGATGANPLSQICKNFISAFENIKKNDEYMEIQPFEREALFTAAIILAWISLGER